MKLYKIQYDNSAPKEDTKLAKKAMMDELFGVAGIRTVKEKKRSIFVPAKKKSVLRTAILLAQKRSAVCFGEENVDYKIKKVENDFDMEK